MQNLEFGLKPAGRGSERWLLCCQLVEPLRGLLGPPANAREELRQPLGHRGGVDRRVCMQRPFAPIVLIVLILLTLIFSRTHCECETRQLSAGSRPARRAAADPTSAARPPLLLPSNVGLSGVVIQQRDARV